MLYQQFGIITPGTLQQNRKAFSSIFLIQIWTNIKLLYFLKVLYFYSIFPIKSSISTGLYYIQGSLIVIFVFVPLRSYQSLRTTSEEDNPSIYLLAYYLLILPPIGFKRNSLGLSLLFLSCLTIPIYILYISSPFSIVSSQALKSTSLLLRQILSRDILDSVLRFYTSILL